MPLSLLFDHFDRLITRPGDLPRLNRAILQLAVQGKLKTDPQTSEVLKTSEVLPDEPASELLKRIRAEKDRLLLTGQTRRDEPLLPIWENETPFEVPNSWVWCRAAEICSYIQRGKSPKYSDVKKYPVIAQKCIQWHGFEMFKAQFIDPETLPGYEEERFIRTGDLLWNSTGVGTLGRIIVYDESFNEYELAVADSHVTVIRPFKC